MSCLAECSRTSDEVAATTCEFQKPRDPNIGLPSRVLVKEILQHGNGGA